MSATTVSTVDQSAADAGTLIPQSKLEDIQRLDTILAQCREVIRESQPMTRAFATAAAMREIEKAITKEMFADIRNLMNSPLGFKTDRRPGQKARNGEEVKEYHDLVIKRCVIVALLAGCELAGNQFNIIAGQCYFTKEFMERTVRSWPGLTEFYMELSPANSHGAKSAVMEGRATWKVNGRPFSVECFKDGDRDMRIVVNAHNTSGPDQLRGLGESKLLRRVVSRLTGLNLDDESNDDVNVVDGKLKSPVHVAHEPAPESVVESLPDEVVQSDGEVVETADLEFENAPEAAAMVGAAEQEIGESGTIVNTTKLATARLNELKSTDWSADAKEWARLQIEGFKAARVAAIRAAK